MENKDWKVPKQIEEQNKKNKEEEVKNFYKEEERNLNIFILGVFGYFAGLVSISLLFNLGTISFYTISAALVVMWYLHDFRLSYCSHYIQAFNTKYLKNKCLSLYDTLAFQLLNLWLCFLLVGGFLSGNLMVLMLSYQLAGIGFCLYKFFTSIYFYCRLLFITPKLNTAENFRFRRAIGTCLTLSIMGFLFQSFLILLFGTL